MFEFLLAAAGYVHPSRWESYGIALVEALALGVPALVSAAIQMAPSLAAGDAALMADPEPAALADGLERLMDSPAGLGARARSFVSTELSWDLILPRYLDKLGRLTNRA